MAITPLPPAPSISDIANFESEMDAFLAAMPVMVTEHNADVIVIASNAAAAAAAATAAMASSSAVAWVSGTTYALGVVVWSPINFLPYRRKVAGGGVTDPSLDSTNWAPQVIQTISQYPGLPDVRTTGFTATANATYDCDTRAAGFTVTMPGTPTAGQWVLITDYGGTAGLKNITLARNGSNIMGLVEDLVINKNNVTVLMVFVNSTKGWQVK